MIWLCSSTYAATGTCTVPHKLQPNVVKFHGLLERRHVDVSLNKTKTIKIKILKNIFRFKKKYYVSQIRRLAPSKNPQPSKVRNSIENTKPNSTTLLNYQIN